MVIDGDQPDDQLRFTHHAHEARRSYLEWQASFDGVEVAGISVLVRDTNGLITDVAIHHRPLNAALRFSTELRRPHFDHTVWKGVTVS